MCDQDIEARRKRDLERFHRRTAERRAKGLCLKCGKRPPAPHRSQCGACAEKQRAGDLARYHRRTAERVAQGLCPKCGKHPPAPGLSQCAPCTEKSNRASRARDARLRAAGIPRRDPEKARLGERRRRRRRTDERRAKGLCPECGKRPPAPGHTVCAPCGEEQRATARARYARGKAAGKLYGGRKVSTRRRIGRERSAKRRAERLAAGLCTSCGTRPSAGDGTQCEPCREARRAFEHERYAARRAAGLCGSCGGPTLDGGSRCGPCAVRETERRSPEKKNASARRLYARRRAKGLCTCCGKRPSAGGGTECEPCREARRAFEHKRYAARRAAGLCGSCGGPTLDGGSRCGPCAVRETERRSPEKKNAAARRLYARRRAKGLCTDCGEPSHGAARCEPCARRRSHRSQHFRGLPLYPPQYTVIELATGEDHGTWDSWDEVALCLAFARLSLDQVEVLTDESPVSRYAAWA